MKKVDTLLSRPSASSHAKATSSGTLSKPKPRTAYDTLAKSVDKTEGVEVVSTVLPYSFFITSPLLK